MAEFDPYYEWLGIPPEEQPANYYRLLGIREFETNTNVIANAADRQMAFLRTFQTGPHAVDSQQLLNQVSNARVVLLNPDKKAEYDRSLQTPSGTPEALGAAVSDVSEVSSDSNATGEELTEEKPDTPALVAPPYAPNPQIPVPPPCPTSSDTDLPVSATGDIAGTSSSSDTAESVPSAQVELVPLSETLPPEVVAKWNDTQQTIQKYAVPAGSWLKRFLSCFRSPAFVLRFCGGLFAVYGAHEIFVSESWLWWPRWLGLFLAFTGILYFLVPHMQWGRKFLRIIAWLLVATGLFFAGELVLMTMNSDKTTIVQLFWNVFRMVGSATIGLGTLWALYNISKEHQAMPEKETEQSGGVAQYADESHERR